MSTQEPTALRRNAISVPHIVFFVIAAAAPLTTVIGVTPAAFAYGNGTGVPGTFLVVGILFLLFSVGFTRMASYVGSAGGFYPYIAAGLGKPVGVAGAFLALLTYNVMDIAIYAMFGYFVNSMVVLAGGPAIHWFIYSVLLAAGVYLCGMRNIEFSGRVLGVCMLAEIGILMVLGTAILLAGGGPEGITIAPFGPAAVFGPGFGSALVFSIGAFMGFEASVIFSEEAKNPQRAIPLATYIAVVLIAVFYAFSTWVISLHYGPSNIVKEATSNIATLYVTAAEARLGLLAGIIMNVLLISSLFGCALAFHNTINRYFFAIARENLLWSRMAKTHPVHQSPYVAGLVQTLLVLAATAVFVAIGLDPYGIVYVWTATLAVIGIITVQALVSLAVIGFFLKDARGVGIWSRLIAPALSFLGLAACVSLMVINLPFLTGSDSPVVYSFPFIVALTGIGGYLFAMWLKGARPRIYDTIGRAFG